MKAKLTDRRTYPLLAAAIAWTALGCGRLDASVSEGIAVGDPTLTLRADDSSETEPTRTPAKESTRALELEAAYAEADRCRDRMVEAVSAPAFPGAPRLEENRALVLLRGKAEPVLFLEEPKYQGEVSAGMTARRRAMLNTKFPRDVLTDTVTTFGDHPELLREALLRDGYLYVDDPRSARLLTVEVSLEDLFKEKEIVLQRGAVTMTATKGSDGVFYFSSGKEAGERARLLLFDRVWLPGSEPGPPLHVDVREVAQREGIEGMRVAHMSQEHLVAEVRFSDEWVPALFERTGVNLDLACLQIDPGRVVEVGRARDEAFRRALVLKALRSAILEQVRLGLPFDEPKTERGQEDGKLLARWEHAYMNGARTYKFNGDTYQVYSERGGPLTPQVCIDFVTESLERASGMRFTGWGTPPEKVLGALDFDELLEGRRRQELAIRNFARLNPHRLDLKDYPVNEWVRYEDIDKFFDFVIRERDEMRAGDIVIIRGHAAWDYYREIHTHTFFVHETDPVTGVPTLLAGNSGKPRVVTWDGEMLRAPKRSIRHRIRPNSEWLYDHVVLRTPLRGERWASPLTVAER